MSDMEYDAHCKRCDAFHHVLHNGLCSECFLEIFGDMVPRPGLYFAGPKKPAPANTTVASDRTTK